MIFSNTIVTSAQGVQASLAEVAKAAGLIRWELAHDVSVMALIAVLLATAGAVNFSRAD